MQTSESSISSFEPLSGINLGCSPVISFFDTVGSLSAVDSLSVLSGSNRKYENAILISLTPLILCILASSGLGGVSDGNSKM